MRRSTALVMVGGLALLGVPLHTWWMLGGDFGEHLRYDTPPGQLPYVYSKLVALYAVELVWLQSLLGLLRAPLVRRGWCDAPAWRKAHAALGAAAAVAVLGHVALFVVATSLRNGAAALDLLLPWGHGVYRTWVAFGAAALWLLLVAIVVRVAWPARAAARHQVHRLALVAVVLAAVHSLAIGSETRSGAMVWLYGVMGATLCVALATRLLDGFAIRSRARVGLS